ncbi:MAG: hypothetical protein H6656_19055 [Ardenticatenaceae bacterium]|nr:hypothetical protein [Ardenticatenaceae bacterium]
MLQIVDKLTYYWWVQLPLALGRISKLFLTVMTDGLYLTVWPLWAAFLPIFSFGLGLLAGWFRFGGSELFSQSIGILFLAIILGYISTQLGFLFVLGYAIIDFFIYDNPVIRYTDFLTTVQIRVALLLLYIALLGLAVFVPLTVKLFRNQVSALFSRSGDLIFIIDSITGIVSAGLLTFIYVQAIPMLVRPLYTWQGQVPPINAIEFLQTSPLALATGAVFIVILRLFWEYGSTAVAPDVIESYGDIIQDKVQPDLWEKLPQLVQLALRIILNIIILAGLIDSLINFFILLLALISLELIRHILPKLLPIWGTILTQVPEIIRLAIVFTAVFFINALFLEGRISGSSFTPLLWAFLIGYFLVALVFPTTPKEGVE